MRTFSANASDLSRSQLPTDEPVMPFANLRDGDWRRRNHGIEGATTGGAARAAPRTPSQPARSLQSQPWRATRPGPPAKAQRRSQNVTARDIELGQVRIPCGVAKTVLPDERTDIPIMLRGRELGACRGDPRYGPPERSGVIRVGKLAAWELLVAGDVLVLTIRGGGVVALE